MGSEKIYAELEASVGKIVKVTFGGQTENVFVISVDFDGFVCKATTSDSPDTPLEFWLGYNEVSEMKFSEE